MICANFGDNSGDIHLYLCTERRKLKTLERFSIPSLLPFLRVLSCSVVLCLFFFYILALPPPLSCIFSRQLSVLIVISILSLDYVCAKQRSVSEIYFFLFTNPEFHSGASLREFVLSLPVCDWFLGVTGDRYYEMETI